MSVSTETARSAFTLSTGTDALAVSTWWIVAAADIAVVRTRAGVDSTLTLNTHYTVAGAGVTTGFTVTMIGQAAADTITVYRNAAIVQGSTYSENGRFPASTVEGDLDSRTMLIQQVSDRASRALRVSPSSNAVAPITTAQMNALLAVTDNATVIYASTYGAVGDGATDDSTAINAALTAGAAMVAAGSCKFATVVLKPRSYYIGTASIGITIPRSVALEGNGAKLIYGGTGIAVKAAVYEAFLRHLIVVNNTPYTYSNAVSDLVGTGLRVQLGAWSYVLGVEVDGFKKAIEVMDSTEVDLISCVASDYQFGLTFNTSNASNICTAIRVFGGALTCGAFASMVGSRGINLDNTGGGTMDGIVIGGTTSEGTVARKLYANAVRRSSFNDIYWDASNGGTDIELSNTTSLLNFSAGAGLDLMVISDSGQGNCFNIPGIGVRVAGEDPYLRIASNAGHYGYFSWYDGAVEKYQLYKANNNTFTILYDIANSRTVMAYAPAKDAVTLRVNEYANANAANAAGLTTGMVYRTGTALQVVV
jgi:hypothetical protein